MLPDYEFKFLCLKMQDELENNKDIVCSLFEALVLVLPIFPSSFWDRLMLVCFYVVLYNVGGLERYYQRKKKYLDAPRNDIFAKILKEEYDADVSADEVDTSASAGSSETGSSASAGSSADEVDAYASAGSNEVDAYASAGSSETGSDAGSSASAGSSADEVDADEVDADEVDASASAGSSANEVDASDNSRESIVGYVNVKGDDLN